MAVVTTASERQRERDGSYAALEERILARDQVGASQVFYDLVKRRPARPRARARDGPHPRAVHPHAVPPAHDSGDVRFVNNDHCLLSMRAALQLKKLVSDDAAFLPMAQTIWYIPTGLDPWNQLLGKAPGHYNRIYNMEFSGAPTPPVAHWPDGEPITLGRDAPGAPGPLADAGDALRGRGGVPDVPRAAGEPEPTASRCSRS